MKTRLLTVLGLLASALGTPWSGQVAAQEAAIQLTHVPANAALLVVGSPRALMLSPMMEMLPREIFSAGSLKETGIDVLDMEQIVVFATPPENGPPAYGVIARFRKDVPLPTAPGVELQVAGRPGLQMHGGPAAPAIIHADSRTLLAAPAPVLEQMLKATGPQGAVAQLAIAASKPEAVVAVIDLAKLRPLLAPQLQNLPSLPPPLESLKGLPQWIDFVALQADLSGSRLNVLLRGTDAAAAQKAQAALVQGLAFGKELARAKVAEEMAREEEPMRSAMMAYADRVANLLEKQFTPQHQGADLRLSIESNYSSAGVMVALLLPAVQSAREAARRMQASNNLKQIGLAMHNYHDVHKAFPARYSSKDGKPLLSWRVHLLPYLDQAALYDQFRLDEPWDSEHNKQLINQIPAAYVSPNQTSPPGTTVFLTASGEGVLLENDKPTPIRSVLDGTSNTIMAVEADNASAVVWTKPDDLPYDPDNPMRGLGQLRPGGFQAVFTDGAVKFIANTVDKKVLQALFSRAGGETVALD